MPVGPESRHAERPVRRAAAADGAPRRVIELRLSRPAASAETVAHRLVQGEGPDALARRFYGDERLWWRILDANPLVHPLDLEPGDVLKVPAPLEATRVVRARRF